MSSSSAVLRRLLWRTPFYWYFPWSVLFLPWRLPELFLQVRHDHKSLNVMQHWVLNSIVHLHLNTRLLEMLMSASTLLLFTVSLQVLHGGIPSSWTTTADPTCTCSSVSLNCCLSSLTPRISGFWWGLSWRYVACSSQAFCCGWCRLFYYYSSNTNGSIFCSSEECTDKHPLQSSIVMAARQHSERRAAPQRSCGWASVFRNQSGPVCSCWRYSGDAVTRETYPGLYYLHAASSVLLSLSDSLSPWYLLLPALLTSFLVKFSGPALVLVFS